MKKEKSLNAYYDTDLFVCVNTIKGYDIIKRKKFFNGYYVPVYAGPQFEKCYFFDNIKAAEIFIIRSVIYNGVIM